MIGFIARRLGAGVVLILVISFIAYLLLFLASGDVSRAILGRNATAEQIAAKDTQLGLDQPLILRFFQWLGRAATGDFGTSWFTSEAVVQSIARALPVTLSIVIGATVVSAILAFALGTFAGFRRGWPDRLVQILAVVGFALPGFLVALVLALVFAIRLGWFPATGYTPITESFGGWIATITLPIAALSVASIAAVAQQVRSSIAEVLQRDFVRTLRSHGVTEARIVFRHVLRNAAVPGLTVLGVQFVGLLSGAVIVEQIFALPGIGALAVSSTARGDVPVVMGVVIVTVVVVVIVNLLVDLAVGWLNPKVRSA